jgi:diguanylate cyclase (GGDEF)-like protein
MLSWHNRLLAQAHTRLGAANQDLQLASKDLARMARHDILTGLPNRLFLQERLKHVADEERGLATAAMMCLDLDEFKDVNDSLGHPVGDTLLQAVATRITAIIDHKGTVARVGGDEFVILLLNTTSEDVGALARALVDAIGKPFLIDGHQIAIGSSIGIALASEVGADPDNLLKSADLALYRAKADGRGNYRFFEPDMVVQLQRRRMIESKLRSARFDTDFELCFQPLIELKSKKITTVEALLRWSGASEDAVLPNEFIPVAEESGLIVPLGRWVLEKACARAAQLPSNINVAVNVSPVQFRRTDIVKTVSTVLAKTGLSPGRLELEITETLLLDDNKDVRSTLRELRSLGVNISLDDFGTGYSSLAYLRRFAVDKVKIDRSFVAGIDRDQDHLAIVQAIGGLADALGMKSVAEGVETEEQLLLVRASGCTEAQGHLFSPPVSSDGIADFFDRLGSQFLVA